MLPVKGGEVFLEKKNILINWRLTDCVEATYEQEASVNHFYDVITWDTKKNKRQILKITRKKKPGGKT